MNRASLPMVLIAAALLAIPASAGPPAVERTEVLQEHGPVRIGAASPTFAGWDLSGGLVSLEHLLPPRAEGTRALVITFFATWCAPCREGLPAFAELDRALADRGVEVLLVAAGEDADKAVPFLDALGISLPTVTDPFLKISEKFGLGTGDTSLPRTFVLDRDGIVRGILGAEGADFPDVLRQQALLAAGEE